MSDLTDEYIVDLLSRITDGPWRVCGADRGGCDCGSIWSTSADIWVASAEHFSSRPGDLECEVCCPKDRTEQKANAEAISHVPNLLKEIVRLRKLKGVA